MWRVIDVGWRMRMFGGYLVPSLLLGFIFIWGCSTASEVKKPAEGPKPAADVQEDKAAQARHYYYDALASMNHGNLKRAEQGFLEALKLNPSSINARLYLAEVYKKMKKGPLAIEQYTEALKYNDKDPRIYSGLMDAYLELDLPAKAIEVGEQALNKGIPPKAVSTNLGWSYYLAGNLDKAEERLKAAKELVKNDTTALNDLGLVYFTEGRYAEALENFREAGRLNPESTLVPYFVALTHNKLGDSGKVLESLREGLKRDPELEKKALYYNKVYFPHGDPGDLSSFFKDIKAAK